MKYIKLSDLFYSEDNPRFIKDERFQKAVNSVLVFPEMLAKRGIVIDEKMRSIGGEMRLRSLKHIIFELTLAQLSERIRSMRVTMREDLSGQNLSEEELDGAVEEREISLVNIWQDLRQRKEIPSEWVIDASDWSEAQRKRFIVADNAHFGQWDWDMLTSHYEILTLDELGVNLLDVGNTQLLDIIHNESEEWVDMPEFQDADNDIKLIIYFDTEAERIQFVEGHEIEVTKKQSKQWISR